MTSELGSRIRRARLAKGLSLRATAVDAGVSPSLLSQVETGKVQPSVSTLYSIVTCLGLSVDELLGTRSAQAAPPRSGVDPVRPREAAPTIVMENGVTWTGLAVLDPEDRVDALHARYEPGACSSVDDSHMRHDGVEYGYVVSGEFTLKLDFDTYVLRAGDSFCFDSRRPHLFVNNGDVPAEGVWFVVGRPTETATPGDEPRSAVDVLHAIGRLPSHPTV